MVVPYNGVYFFIGVPYNGVYFAIVVPNKGVFSSFDREPNMSKTYQQVTRYKFSVYATKPVCYNRVCYRIEKSMSLFLNIVIIINQHSFTTIVRACMCYAEIERWLLYDI